MVESDRMPGTHYSESRNESGHKCQKHHIATGPDAPCILANVISSKDISRTSGGTGGHLV